MWTLTFSLSIILILKIIRWLTWLVMVWWLILLVTIRWWIFFVTIRWFAILIKLKKTNILEIRLNLSCYIIVYWSIGNTAIPGLDFLNHNFIAVIIININCLLSLFTITQIPTLNLTEIFDRVLLILIFTHLYYLLHGQGCWTRKYRDAFLLVLGIERTRFIFGWTAVLVYVYIVAIIYLHVH